jgi:hypothetical protein
MIIRPLLILFDVGCHFGFKGDTPRQAFGEGEE